jgi:hypothetical protein
MIVKVGIFQTIFDRNFRRWNLFESRYEILRKSAAILSELLKHSEIQNLKFIGFNSNTPTTKYYTD